MSRSGFTKLHRRVEEHWLYNLGPWDAWHLWEHLWNVMASWEKTDVYYMRRVHKVERGELVTSLSHLARLSGWSRARVRRFLQQIEKADMIRTANGQGVIRVTICNYGRWQDRPVEADTTCSSSRSPGGQAATTDKEEKKRRRKDLKKAAAPRGAKRGGEVTKVGVALEDTVGYFVKRALTCSPEAARFNLERIDENKTKVPPEVYEALQRRAGRKPKKQPAHA